jgi:hypothetical protein
MGETPKAYRIRVEKPLERARGRKDGNFKIGLGKADYQTGGEWK